MFTIYVVNLFAIESKGITIKKYSYTCTYEYTISNIYLEYLMKLYKHV